MPNLNESPATKVSIRMSEYDALFVSAAPAQKDPALTDGAVRKVFALAGASSWHVADPNLAREVVKAALLTAVPPAGGPVHQ